MIKFVELLETVFFVNERIEIKELNLENYISTENMQANRGGIAKAIKLPQVKTTIRYKENDILISNIRLYFKKIWIANGGGGTSSDILVLRTKKRYDSKFIYYVLSDTNFFNYADVTSKGTKMPRGDKNAILKYPIPNLNLEIQKKIANILSTYDELIENNNRRIEIIEKAAEEIYKEWFVRMRFPAYEKAEFEKGIPQGWEVVELSKVIGIADGTHDTPKKTNIGVPLVTGKNIANGSIDFNSTYNISLEDFKKINIRSAIYKNDILYSNIGTIGLMTLVNEDNKYSVKNLIILKTSEHDFYEYIYILFNSKSSQRFFESVANGASQKFISLTEMRKYKILLPCSKLLAEFKLNVKELFKESRNLKAQNQKLIKQRDMLLPRLMNGTIEVK